MNRIAIAIAVGLLACCAAGASEICTPVDMSWNTPNTTGTGNGPDVEFIVQNIRYMNGQTASVRGTVVVSFGTVFINQNYINVHAAWNGCNHPWVYQMFNTYTITRLSDGVQLFNKQLNTGSENCGNFAFCKTPEWNSGEITKDLPLGEYQFDSYIFTVVTVDGVGTFITPTYHNAVKIEVSGIIP